MKPFDPTNSNKQLTPTLGNCPEIITLFCRRTDFQSVQIKTDWKYILRFANPHLILGQLL